MVNFILPNQFFSFYKLNDFFLLVEENSYLHITADMLVKRQMSFNNYQIENLFSLPSYLLAHFFLGIASIVRV